MSQASTTLDRVTAAIRLLDPLLRELRAVEAELRRVEVPAIMHPALLATASATERVFGMDRRSLLYGGRPRPLVQARWAMVAVFNNLCPRLGVTEIARQIGCDHGTVHHALNQWHALCCKDEIYAQRSNQVMQLARELWADSIGKDEVAA